MVALAAPAAWAWYMSSRLLTATNETERRRLRRLAVMVSAGIGVAILAMGVAAFVLTGYNWLVLALTWSFGLCIWACLRGWPGECSEGLANDYVFTTGWGEPVHPDTVSSLMATLINAHNQPDDRNGPVEPLPPARLHDLRHIHATTLLLPGVPVHVVAARLGHADPSIRYLSIRVLTC